MSDKSETKDKSLSPNLWIFVVVAAIALGLLVIFKRDALEETWQTLLNANIYYVLLLPVIQVINYSFIGEYYRRMFSRFSTKISRARSWGVVAAMNFVNQILPSGGLSGITYLAYGFKSRVDTGKTTLIQLGRYIFSFGAYALLGPIALLLVMFADNTDELNGILTDFLRDPIAVSVFLAFIALGLLVASAVFWKGANRSIARFIAHFINFVKVKILRFKDPFKFTFIKKIMAEFHEGMDLVSKEGWGILRPAVFMLFSSLAEISIVYVSFLAVNSSPPIEVVFLSFVAANIAGVISVVPGDVGVHEAVMIIVLSAFGVSEAVAISATLLYRVFNKFIFLPIGFYFYAKILKPVTAK